MANQKQSSLRIFLLIGVIAIAIFFVVRAARPKKTPRSMADWTDVKDGSKFVAPTQPGPIKNPKDGDEAVRTIYYECSAHGKRFEAYRVKPIPGGGPISLEMLYKVPGGKWTKSTKPPRVVCPHGMSDPKVLKYSPPKS